MDFTTLIKIPVISLSLLFCSLPLQTCFSTTKFKSNNKKKYRKQAYNKKQSKQTNKKEQLKKISWHGSYSVAVPESHTVYPLFHIFLLVSVHCNVSLVWFDIPGFSSILVLHWDSSWISIVALCHGDHVVYICRSGPFM